jgi:nucleotide-binding universal stress UspA family protein
MATILLCTDGSDLATEALQRGTSLLAPADRTVIVSVDTELDPTAVTGAGGFAGPTMTADEYDVAAKAARAAAESDLARTKEALGLDTAETQVLAGGDAGPAIVALATEIGADAVVMGSRGRSGLKRAVLGSVSDHVVRNAPCTVVVTGPSAE